MGWRSSSKGAASTSRGICTRRRMGPASSGQWVRAAAAAHRTRPCHREQLLPCAPCCASAQPAARCTLPGHAWYIGLDRAARALLTPGSASFIAGKVRGGDGGAGRTRGIPRAGRIFAHRASVLAGRPAQAPQRPPRPIAAATPAGDAAAALLL